MITERYQTVELIAKALKDCDWLLFCQSTYQKLQDECDSIATRNKEDLTECQKKYLEKFEDLVDLKENADFVFSCFDGSLTGMALHLLDLSAFFYRYWVENFDSKPPFPSLYFTE